MRFLDRRDAGRRLADALAGYRAEDPLVLGLPRGGVPVAAEVARTLGAPLDVFVVRKIGAPQHPEFGIGAIASGGERVLDEASIRALRIPREEIDAVIDRESKELARRLEAYRGERPYPDVAGRVVLVVDDGVATGGTARVAARALRERGPAKLVLAVPVGPPDSVEALASEYDEVVVLETPARFAAVGAWYEDFGQTTDEEVVEILASAGAPDAPSSGEAPQEVRIPSGAEHVVGTLRVPAAPVGLVVFAHGSGSSRFSVRNNAVAERLHEAGLATLLLDLLTPREERVDARTREYRFDIPRLAGRLVDAVDWLAEDARTRRLRLGSFGSSTGAAAALIAAARRPDVVRAVVSRGGRPDLAGDDLPDVRAATLFVVGGRDEEVLRLNEDALDRIEAEKRLAVVEGATHLFEEPGALEEVADLAAQWFREKLRAPRREAPA